MGELQTHDEHRAQPSAMPDDAPERDVDFLLLARAQHGDEGALAALYDRWVDKVYSIAVHLVRDPDDAEELVERTFQQVWAEADRYSPERGSVAAWIIVIARSEALSRRRTNKRRAQLNEFRNRYLVHEGARSCPSPLQEVEMRERQERVGHAMRRLPDDQERVVRMTFFDGLSQTQIARELGVPLGTVKTRVRLAFAKLRGSLAGLRESA